MNTQFTQPKRVVAVETNKQAIARALHSKPSNVAYLAVNFTVDNYTILYDRGTQTTWDNTLNPATGSVISWDINDNVLILVTSLGSFTLRKIFSVTNLEMSSANGALMIGVKASLDASITRTLQERLNDRISVKDFGAKGDGTADDTTAIQAALNTGYPVYLPPGNYVISTGLVIPAGGSLVGAGSRVATLKPANNIIAVKGTGSGSVCTDLGIVFDKSNSSGNAVVWADEALSGLVRNLWILNAYDSVSVGNCQSTLVDHIESWFFLYSGIRLTDNFNDVFFSNCFLNGAKNNSSEQGTSSVGIRATGKAHAMFFQNMEVIQCNQAVNLNGNGAGNILTAAFSFFMNCFFDSGTSACAINNARDLHFIGCWFSNRDSGLAISTSTSIRFIGCQFVNNSGHGIIIQSGCVDISISDSLFDSNGQTQASTYYGIVCNPTTFLSIVNCTFGNMGTFAATQQGVAFLAGTYSNIDIRGNKFHSSLVGTVLSNGMSGAEIYIRDNLGLRTKSKGQSSVPANAASQTVAHGLAVIPSIQDVQLGLTSGRAGVGDFYVSAVTATTFTVAMSPAPSANITFRWSVDSEQRA